MTCGYEIDETSVIGYIFHHRDEISACDKIAKYITKSILKTQLPDPSRYDLYAEVTKGQWTGKPLIDPYVKLDDTYLNVQTLSASEIALYKPLFNSAQWKSICLFEHHFGIFTKKNFKTLSLTEADSERRKFFNLCNSTRTISK